MGSCLFETVSCCSIRDEDVDDARVDEGLELDAVMELKDLDNGFMNDSLTVDG
jgi:hypothetical protein